MNRSLHDRATDLAFEALDRAGGEPRELPEAMRIVVLVIAAEGVIDNGGLRFFFENDWPDRPPYSTFSAAFRTIGADDFADAIDTAAALFPGAEPERDTAARLAFLATPEAAALDRLDESWSSDLESLLGRYIDAHLAEFGLDADR